ncbi:MAG: fructose-6-phosphate aldolase [Cuniculiplasma sp.]
MKLFLDTANIDEIRQANEWGLLDGVTTNPSLVAKEMKKGASFKEIVSKILNETPGPVSIEVIASDYDSILKQALKISSLGGNAVVKVPFNTVGLKATKALDEKRIPVNSTLIFSGIQALFAAKAGAKYVSPFVGRLDDIAEDGMALIEQIKTIYINYNMKTNILVASIRNPLHVLRSMLIGADVVTLPFDVLSKLPSHPKSDEGLSRFLEDWEKAFGSMEFPL